MEKALPWILGILALLVIWACEQVGWLYFFLAIGIVGCVLWIFFWLMKKSVGEDTAEIYKKSAKITTKAVAGIAVCLIIVGAVIGGIGILTPETDGYRLEECGYCGGSGILTSGKKCSLCDGAGGAISENSVYADSTSVGILIAASGTSLFFGMLTIKDEALSGMYSSQFRINNGETKFRSDVADITILLGHWKENEHPSKTWIRNKPNITGAWSVRCSIRYKSSKSASKISLTFTPCDNNGIAVSDVVHYSSTKLIYNKGKTYALSWSNLWEHLNVAHVNLKKVEIQFTDGTIQTFSNL